MSTPAGATTGHSPLFAEGACVLFQGDSITDMGRGRTEDPNHLMGHGYAFIIAAMEAARFPERGVTFFNRGVSGNTVADLAARWQTDALDLKPDVLSVLVGVNDLNHRLRAGEAFSAADYETAYDKLLAAARESRPHSKIILGEPFLAPGKETVNQFQARVVAMEEMREVILRLAEKYHAAVVHYQRMFDDAAGRAPADYWIWDGVHPTFAAHQLMADEWRRAYRAFHVK